MSIWTAAAKKVVCYAEKFEATSTGRDYGDGLRDADWDWA
jgi:hypothetical protein